MGIRFSIFAGSTLPDLFCILVKWFFKSPPG
jgi:hypothetical protein